MTKRMLYAILMILLLSPAIDYAQGFNSLTFYPSLDGKGICALSPYTGTVWNFRVTTMVIYEKSPLQIGTSRDDTEDVIPHLSVTYWGASLNLPYRLQGFLLLPWNTYAKIEDPINDINKSVSTFGDISFGLKYSFETGRPLPRFAVALEGIIPSGSPEYYLGTPYFTYKLILISGYKISQHYIYGNLSYTARKAEQIMNLTFDDQIGFIFGYSFPQNGRLNFAAELQGETLASSPFKYEPMNPIELNGRIRLTEESFDWGIIAGTGLTKGVGAPDYRLGVFISYPPTKPYSGEEIITEKKVDTSCLKYFLTRQKGNLQPDEKCANAEFGYITGKVETFSGFPIKDALIIIQPGDIRVKLNSKGEFIVKLKPGIYYVKANKEKFTSTEALVELKPREVKRVKLRMKLLEGTLIIRLYNYKLQQIGGTVSIYSGSRLLKRYRITSRGAMIKLPPGEYVIEGGIKGYKNVSKIVEILPGKKTEVDLIIK